MGVFAVGLFRPPRQGLTRTKQQIVDRFDEIVERADTEPDRTRAIDVDTVEALEELLISADVGIAATEQIVTAVRERARRGESLRDLVKDRDTSDLRCRGHGSLAERTPLRTSR